jgi:hypothetical protein
MSLLLKREQDKKAETMARREATVKAEFDRKENGVRVGTLVLLGIMEHTEEVAREEDSIFDQFSRKVAVEVRATQNLFPHYAPMVD